MSTVHDDEFGEITVHRNIRATSVKISVTPSGTLKASLPPYAPLFVLKRLLASSRNQLRAMLSRHVPAYQLEHGMQIGKSHKLVVGHGKRTYVKMSGLHVVVSLAEGAKLTDDEVQRMVRDTVIQALRVEAKNYLPKRLAHLAATHGYSYKKTRFSHASTRWGSCSSNGTISLNIALMKLPDELIDYVIIHELCHTKQMNHSKKFWSLVEKADPYFKTHRKLLKSQNPTL